MPDTPQTYDELNHPRQTPGTAITAAAAGTSAAGTVIPVNAGAGAGSATAIESGQNPVDAAGRFTLAAAGTPATGKQASLFFTNAWDKAPIVEVDAYDSTGAAAVSIIGIATTTQIDFYTATALTAAHTYIINYTCRES